MKQTKFEQQKYNEMRRSLCIEFKYAKKPSIHKILTEAKGMMEGSDEIINAVLYKMQQETQNGKINAKVVINQNDILPFLKTQPFFENIAITINYEQAPKMSADGQYTPMFNFLTSDKKMFNVNIECNFEGIYTEIQNEIEATLEHELLHAYEDYQRLVKTGKDLGDASRKSGVKANYKALSFAEESNNKIIRQLCLIYYYSTSNEVKAYIAGFKRQIKYFKNTITNADEAMEIVKNTECYESYVRVGEILNDIIINLEGNREYIEKWYQLVYNKKLSAGKIMRRLRNLYNTSWYKIRKNIASYIRYIYEQQ